MEKFLIIKQSEPSIEVAKIYCDGSCRGNGRKNSKSGIGILIKYKSIDIEISEYIGKGLTNNVSEYRSLIKGLEKASSLDIKNVHVFMDSKLVCEQIRGNYKVKNPRLKSLYKKAKVLSSEFEIFRISHIPRELNKRADMLANKCLYR